MNASSRSRMLGLSHAGMQVLKFVALFCKGGVMGGYVDTKGKKVDVKLGSYLLG